MASPGPPSFLDRHKRTKEAILRDLERQRKEREAEELKECVFRPKTSAGQHFSVSTVPLLERFELASGKKEADIARLRKERDEREKAEAIFRPKLSSLASQLKRRASIGAVSNPQQPTMAAHERLYREKDLRREHLDQLRTTLQENRLRAEAERQAEQKRFRRRARSAEGPDSTRHSAAAASALFEEAARRAKRASEREAAVLAEAKLLANRGQPPLQTLSYTMQREQRTNFLAADVDAAVSIVFERMGFLKRGKMIETAAAEATPAGEEPAAERYRYLLSRITSEIEHLVRKEVSLLILKGGKSSTGVNLAHLLFVEDPSSEDRERAALAIERPRHRRSSSLSPSERRMSLRLPSTGAALSRAFSAALASPTHSSSRLIIGPSSPSPLLKAPKPDRPVNRPDVVAALLHRQVRQELLASDTGLVTAAVAELNTAEASSSSSINIRGLILKALDRALQSLGPVDNEVVLARFLASKARGSVGETAANMIAGEQRRVLLRKFQKKADAWAAREAKKRKELEEKRLEQEEAMMKALCTFKPQTVAQRPRYLDRALSLRQRRHSFNSLDATLGVPTLRPENATPRTDAADDEEVLQDPLFGGTEGSNKEALEAFCVSHAPTTTGSKGRVSDRDTISGRGSKRATPPASPHPSTLLSFEEVDNPYSQANSMLRANDDKKANRIDLSVPLTLPTRRIARSRSSSSSSASSDNEAGIAERASRGPAPSLVEDLSSGSLLKPPVPSAAVTASPWKEYPLSSASSVVSGAYRPLPSSAGGSATSSGASTPVVIPSGRSDVPVDLSGVIDRVRRTSLELQHLHARQSQASERSIAAEDKSGVVKSSDGTSAGSSSSSSSLASSSSDRASSFHPADGEARVPPLAPPPATAEAASKPANSSRTIEATTTATLSSASFHPRHKPLGYDEAVKFRREKALRAREEEKSMKQMRLPRSISLLDPVSFPYSGAFSSSKPSSPTAARRHSAFGHTTVMVLNESLNNPANLSPSDSNSNNNKTAEAPAELQFFSPIQASSISNDSIAVETSAASSALPSADPRSLLPSPVPKETGQLAVGWPSSVFSGGSGDSVASFLPSALMATEPLPQEMIGTFPGETRGSQKRVRRGKGSGAAASTAAAAAAPTIVEAIPRYHRPQESSSSFASFMALPRPPPPPFLGAGLARLQSAFPPPPPPPLPPMPPMASQQQQHQQHQQQQAALMQMLAQEARDRAEEMVMAERRQLQPRAAIRQQQAEVALALQQAQLQSEKIQAELQKLERKAAMQEASHRLAVSSAALDQLINHAERQRAQLFKEIAEGPLSDTYRQVVKETAAAASHVSSSDSDTGATRISRRSAASVASADSKEETMSALRLGLEKMTAAVKGLSFVSTAADGREVMPQTEGESLLSPAVAHVPLLPASPPQAPAAQSLSVSSSSPPLRLKLNFQVSPGVSSVVNVFEGETEADVTRRFLELNSSALNLDADKVCALEPLIRHLVAKSMAAAEAGRTERMHCL